MSVIKYSADLIIVRTQQPEAAGVVRLFRAAEFKWRQNWRENE